MKYLHFFWDYDGTLYDTYPRITRAVKKTLHEFGIEATEAEVHDQVKLSLRHAWAHFCQERGIDNDTYMARYRTHADEEGTETMRPYPGIPEMLRAVVKNGGKNYLYTHRGLNAWEFLRNDGLDTLFCDGVTNKDGFPAKPAPDALNFLAEKHHLNKSECIMMGDRDIDLDAGKNAGMACALFDPENFYPDYDTPYRYRDADAMRRELAGE